jgi:hypothetical protein
VKTLILVLTFYFSLIGIIKAQYIPFITGCKNFEYSQYFVYPNETKIKSKLYCQEAYIKSNNICFATNITAVLYDINGNTSEIIKSPYCYYNKDTQQVFSPSYIELISTNQIIKGYGYSCCITNLNHIIISNKIEFNH